MKLALKLLWRDWRSGELNILVFSLIFAVATITSISLFTSRLENSIGDEAATFFAGDARIQSSIPFEPRWLEMAAEQQLAFSNAISFRAMTFAGDAMQLAAVKAVSSRYPLKGELEVAKQPFGEAKATHQGPAPGEVWLASRLFSALKVQVGDKINIGEAEFTLTQALIREPDDTQSFFGVAPRALIHIDDVPATQAVQPGSRVNYTLMIAGKQNDLEEYHEQLKPLFGDHANWSDAKSGNRNIGAALERAEKFLLLAGSLSVILTGVAIALAARRYAERHITQVALLKTLGQNPNTISRFYFLQILTIGLFCIAIGAIAGELLHNIIIVALGNLMPESLSHPSPSAYGTGVLSGIVALFAFAAPPLLSLRQIPPVKVLQQNASGGVLATRWAFAIGFISITALVYWFAWDLKLTAILVAGSSVSLLGVSALGWLLIKTSKHISNYLSPSWKLGVANLHRHLSFNVIQIMIFSTLLMLMFILLLVRTSLIDQWRDKVPENAPNHFIFNIFNDELDEIKALVKDANISTQPFYPMFRGRVIDVNGIPTKKILENTEPKMNYRRELNLTWTDSLGSDNKILAGQWHGKNPSDILEVSTEEEYARGLNINVGDTVSYSVAGSKFSAKVTSIRSVDWDSMNPNFFMIFNQPVLEGTATNWLTSAHLKTDKKTFLNTLAQRFPTVSIIEIDQMIDQVRRIISQISRAIEFILALVLCAGTLVFITSIQATLDVRFQESAILRTLGAKRAFIRNQLLVEFCTLGGLSGLLAAAGTEVTLFFLQTQVFELGFSFHWRMWILAIPSGILLVGLVGWLSSKSVTKIPPLVVLRNLSNS